MKHFVKDDVFDEKLRHALLVEIGVNTDEVIFFRETAQSNGSATTFRREFSPNNRRIDFIVEFLAIDFVVEGLDVVHFPRS